MLDQYKDKGNGIGYDAQNSIVDFTQQQVIHYPKAADFEGRNIINTARQRRAELQVQAQNITHLPGLNLQPDLFRRTSC